MQAAPVLASPSGPPMPPPAPPAPPAPAAPPALPVVSPSGPPVQSPNAMPDDALPETPRASSLGDQIAGARLRRTASAENPPVSPCEKHSSRDMFALPP